MAITFGIAFVSCKDSDDSDTPSTPKTKESILNDQTWLLDSARNGVQVSLSSNVRFRSDKTFKNETMLANPISSGSWSVSGDTLVLSARLFNNNNQFASKYLITELTTEKMVLREDFKTNTSAKTIMYYYSKISL